MGWLIMDIAMFYSFTPLRAGKLVRTAIPIAKRRAIKQCCIIAGSIILIASCAATIYDTSSVSYIKEDFGSTNLVKGGLALLPIVAGQGQEGYRRPFGEALNEGIAQSRSEIPFLPWQETMSLMNENDLAELYLATIQTYRETAIIDKKLLSEIGATLDIRFLMFVSLEEFHKESNTSYGFFSGWHTKKTAKVRAFAQIWDCHSGDVVWEGFGSAESSGGELTYEKAYVEYAKTAANGLVLRLPK